MDIFDHMGKLNRRLATLIPKKGKLLYYEIQIGQEEAIARAENMRGVYWCCPHHGYPIWKIGKSKYDLWGKIFEFDNLICTPLGEPGHYCEVDISNDPQLLKMLAKRTPLSKDEFFSSKPEPDLAKAKSRDDDICPYCGNSGGTSLTLGYLEAPILPRTLTLRKMDCGHEYAIVYHIS